LTIASRAIHWAIGVVVLVAMAAASATHAQAQTYPWCANFADGAGVNCGFSTREQCLATSMGSGGTCTQNNDYRPSGAAAARRQHRAPKHPLHKNP
jgi:Protein of unknown function (DUF3551)